MGAVPDTVELTFWLRQVTSDISLRSDGSLCRQIKQGRELVNVGGLGGG